MEKNLWAEFRSIAIRYRKEYALAFGMVLLGNSLLILNPLLLRQALEALDPSIALSEGMMASFLRKITHWALGNYITSLPIWVILLTSTALLGAYLKYSMRLSFVAISRRVERNTRGLIFERIQSHTLEFFDKHRIGDLMSRLTNDISVYRDVLGPGVMYPCYFITLVIPAMIGLFSISSWLALLSLLPICLLPLLMAFAGNPIYSTSMQVQEELAAMSTLVHENYSGIRITKSYNTQMRMFKRFQEQCQRLFKLSVRLDLIQGLFYPFLMLVTRLITVGMVLFAGFIILKAWRELSSADLISFMWIQSYVYMPVLMLGWVLPMYERGGAAYARLVEIVDEPLEIHDNTASTLEITPLADIDFSKLSFTYPKSSNPVIADFDLHIKGGSFVGITGPIGAGKTTLFKLLIREYDLPHGMLFLHGHDIHDYSLEALRRAIVTVEQRPFLFSKTIAENVSFGFEGASKDDLETVTRLADLHETIRSFPDQYETLVGERGMTLSGGQKQRMAMARAFLVKRSILLFDDIFSAVDMATEQRIFKGMQQHFAGKTVLLITHRVSILEQMDRIIYMQGGKIVEDGSHKQLLEKKGLYAALADLQSMTNAEING